MQIQLKVVKATDTFTLKKMSLSKHCCLFEQSDYVNLWHSQCCSFGTGLTILTDVSVKFCLGINHYFLNAVLCKLGKHNTHTCLFVDGVIIIIIFYFFYVFYALQAFIYLLKKSVKKSEYCEILFHKLKYLFYIWMYFKM